MSKKSLIPANAQVPVAIVLAILFTLLLWWRFAPKKEAEETTTVMISSGETEVEVSLDELQTILAEIQAGRIKHASRGTSVPTLLKNPFERLEKVPMPDPLLEIENESDPRNDERLLEIRQREHDQQLATMALTATGITGKSAIALINGKYFKVGDMVEGFVVKKIREREVTIEDQLGTEIIRMPEVPTL